jgi:3-phosphoshikimate 1-carboxyvinyltransferase
MIKIKPLNNINADIIVPGSKSYTHRILIASALSNGSCAVTNALRSEDTLLTLEALQKMGVHTQDHEGILTIRGTGGKLRSPKEIFLGNSGTSMRLLTALAALGNGKTILTGTERMKSRPIEDLISGMQQMDIPVRSVNNTGCPPVEVMGGNIKGGSILLRCGISSQYLSALLLIAPFARDGLDVTIIEGPVSRPYIDMTLEVMAQFGISVERQGYERFRIPGGQVYQSGDYTVESDASNASYFWAAAAVTGGRVKVKGISPSSRQGDLRLLECFKQMGCTVIHEPDGIVVKGGSLTAIEVDMADMPDMVPTLGVMAAFAQGTTKIKNVAHLKAKESDRLAAVAAELTKMGIRAETADTGLTITGGVPHAAEIDTYNDHRIAMCFAVAGLKVPGVVIKDETCVEKSFPNFWETFERLKGEE